MRRDKELLFNGSGYRDNTAYDALKPMVDEEQANDKKVHNIINTLKFIVDWAGFEFIGRIQLRDKKTKREYK